MASGMNLQSLVVARFSKTKSPAYAPASASSLFPAFRFAAERRDSLDRRKDSRPPAVKFAPANRSQHRVNQAIEKMLQRDYPAAAAPNRFLGVGCARMDNGVQVARYAHPFS